VDRQNPERAKYHDVLERVLTLGLAQVRQAYAALLNNLKRCSMRAAARQESYEADFGQANRTPKISNFSGLYKST
jgi:hypothetical protein